MRFEPQPGQSPILTSLALYQAFQETYLEYESIFSFHIIPNSSFTNKPIFDPIQIYNVSHYIQLILTSRVKNKVPVHAVKAYRGHRSRAPLFNIGFIWRWVVSFTPRPLSHLGKNPSAPNSLGGHRRCLKIKIPVPAGNRKNGSPNLKPRHYTDWAANIAYHHHHNRAVFPTTSTQPLPKPILRTVRSSSSFSPAFSAVLKFIQ